MIGWHASAISLPPGDVIFAQPACPLNDVIVVYIRNNKPISLQTLRSSSRLKSNIIMYSKLNLNFKVLAVSLDCLGGRMVISQNA
jgi:hypothetical protein